MDGGFLPGGASLHLCMTPHGPDTQTFERAVGGQGQGQGPSHLGHETLVGAGRLGRGGAGRRGILEDIACGR